MRKLLLAFATLIFVGAGFLLLYIVVDGDGSSYDVTRTPQNCADLYRALTPNVRSQYNGSEDFINSCVN